MPFTMRLPRWSIRLVKTTLFQLRWAVPVALLVVATVGALTIPETALAQATVDYDYDDDNLIEISTLAQLNAMRWDLDGDGAADATDDGAS